MCMKSFFLLGTLIAKMANRVINTPIKLGIKAVREPLPLTILTITHQAIKKKP